MTSNPAASSSNAPTFKPAQSFRAAHPDPAREPPRKQSETRSARERFSAKLEQSSEKSSKAGDAVKYEDTSDQDRLSAYRDQDNGSSNTGSHSDHANAQVSQTIQLQALANSSTTQPSGPTIDTVMLERMAAQIAESWPTGGAQQASITFPDTAIAQAAYIIREPDGSMAVRIAGLDPKLAAVKQAQLQLQLSGALARRRLKIASLQFETVDQLRGARPDVPGDDPAISRAV